MAPKKDEPKIVDLLVKWADEHGIPTIFDTHVMQENEQSKMGGSFNTDSKNDLQYLKFYSKDPAPSIVLHETTHAFMHTIDPTDSKFAPMDNSVRSLYSLETGASKESLAKLEGILGAPSEYNDALDVQKLYLGNLIDESRNPGTKWPEELGHPMQDFGEVCASFANYLAYGDMDKLEQKLGEIRKTCAGDPELRSVYPGLIRIFSESSQVLGQFVGQLKKCQPFFGEPPPPELANMEKNLAQFNLYLKSANLALNPAGENKPDQAMKN